MKVDEILTGGRVSSYLSRFGNLMLNDRHWTVVVSCHTSPALTCKTNIIRSSSCSLWSWVNTCLFLRHGQRLDLSQNASSLSRSFSLTYFSIWHVLPTQDTSRLRIMHITCLSTHTTILCFTPAMFVELANSSSLLAPSIAVFASAASPKLTIIASSSTRVLVMEISTGFYCY